MKFFLDSAKIDEIEYARANWGIDGVTTNPKHILASGKPFMNVVREMAEKFASKDFSVSVEINPHLDKAEEMFSEALKFHEISKHFAIKIPCTEQGLIATKHLAEEGVQVNVTLVFSPSQALQAGRLGAAYVSPFVGWKESSGEDCWDFITKVSTIYANYDFDTEIIVAALRNGNQIVDAAVAGADITTAGFDVYKSSFYHPFTDYGLKVFCDAWDQFDEGK